MGSWPCHDLVFPFVLASQLSTALNNAKNHFSTVACAFFGGLQFLFKCPKSKGYFQVARMEVFINIRRKYFLSDLVLINTPSGLNYKWIWLFQIHFYYVFRDSVIYMHSKSYIPKQAKTTQLRTEVKARRYSEFDHYKQKWLDKILSIKELQLIHHCLSKCKWPVET